ncbi:MAG: flagellar biosynthetic protein FliR [Kangiellaceae bacterium]|jgi:flagellar biosynthetic protein FliR|nr:flagellar biosynthetic protein FliR [Kangiellaceae bacterium]
MTFDFATINDWLAIYILPFCRIAGMATSMAIIGTRMVSARVRLSLALALAIVAAPMMPAGPAIELFSLTTIIQVALQTLIGLAIGFVTRVVLETFVVAGQLVAMQTGLGFASLIDQNTGVSVPTLGQMFVMMATLIFLAVDGHLRLIELVMLSFQSLPITESANLIVRLDLFVYWAEVIFITAFMMVLSAIVALLIMNISLGIMTRSAPQLNIFAVGFPIMTIVGMTIIWLLLKSFLPHFINQIDRGHSMVCQLVLLEC